jgi:hypothetical protein
MLRRPKGRSEKIMLKKRVADSATEFCTACRFFTGAPAALERALPGVNILSSTYGSVRADTGLCERHGVFTTARTTACAQFDNSKPDGAVAESSNAPIK